MAPAGVTPAGKARAIRHFERLAHRYDGAVSRGPLGLLRARERAAVLRLAELSDPAVRTVLDAGCGDGVYARAAKRAGKWAHAMDASAAMVERVRPHVDLAEQADVEAFEPGRAYDLVLCCGVLDFVTAPGPALERLCRLCAPGGRLVVLLPRAGAGGLLYRLEKACAGLEVNLFRRAFVAELAGRAGLALTAASHPLPFNMVLRLERARARRRAAGERRAAVADLAAATLPAPPTGTAP